MGLHLLVPRETGVVYATHTAGLLTEVRRTEGFLVPLMQHEKADALAAFFEREFSGHSYPPVAEWTEERLAALQRLLDGVHVWETHEAGPGADRLHRGLALDRSRLAELAEAWVPVASPYGQAVLLFRNSD